MKILMTSLFTVLMSIPSHAADVFPERELGDLYVVEVSSDEGRALVRDRNANEAEVYLGDTLGVESATVIEIDRASITLQVGGTKTKMLVYGSEGTQAFETGPAGGSIPSLRTD
ncbi:MAG: hypothetical protein JRJ03_12565 [Deltaproteobacteria bacterium]|nr:hypothetical protein [Deltaproteobacteria bacterium]